jgi:hypothetical protein
VCWWCANGVQANQVFRTPQDAPAGGAQALASFSGTTEWTSGSSCMGGGQ